MSSWERVKPRYIFHCGFRKAGENSRRMQGSAFGITPVLDRRTGLSKDGSFNTIFLKSSHLAVNSTTNQPTVRFPQRAADSISADSSISTTTITYFFLLDEVCPELQQLPGTLAFNLRSSAVSQK